MMMSNAYGNSTFKHDLALAIVPAVISILLQNAIEHWRHSRQEEERELSPEEEERLEAEATEGLRKLIREEVSVAVAESFKSYTKRSKTKSASTKLRK